MDPWHTVRELLDFYAVVSGGHVPAWADGMLNLTSKPGMPLGRLGPRGRRTAGIVTAVAHRPRLLVLVLDEPTAPLDPPPRRQVWRRVSEFAASGTRVLVASRTTDHVEETADRVGFLGRGGMTICQGGCIRQAGRDRERHGGPR